MTFRSVMRLGVSAFGLLVMTALSGCSAISSIESSATPLGTYELSPLPAAPDRARRGRHHLEIAMPTATGALTSDRIVIKPNALEVQTLPDARWVNDATEHVQLLLVRSLANSGRFSLVTSAGTGPSPDYVLMTDLQAFQAEVVAQKTVVVIEATLTLLNDQDGAIVASRSFSSAVPVADTSTAQVVAGFDAAMTQQLTELVSWLVARPGL